MIKKIFIFSISFVLLILLVLAILPAARFNLSLSINGYNYQNYRVISEEVDSSNQIYKILLVKSKDDEMQQAIIRIKKYWLFWQIENAQSMPLDGTGNYTFIQPNFSLAIPQFDEDLIYFETTTILYGNNAINKIELNHELIPFNTTYNIYQTQNEFFIIFKYYDSQETVKLEDIVQYLEEKELIH